jgi:hypothetical protein
MEGAPWKGFEPLNQAQWKELALRGLRGTTWEELSPPRRDGWDVPIRVDPQDPLAQPVGLPDRSICPPSQGQMWQVQQTLNEPKSLMQALMHGVEGLRISEAAQQTHGLGKLLDGVYLDMVDVHLDGPEATGLLRDLVERELSPEHFTGSCSRDILQAFDAGELARHVEAWGAAFPRLLTWGCDAAPWLDAGVSLVDALSAVVSGWDAGVDALEKEGISFDLAIAQCTVRWSVGSEVLIESSALRALRMLWSKWLSHRHQPHRPLWIDARTSTRNFVLHQPEDNLLRTTVSSYAAVLGGADGIETLPHDFRLGVDSESSRRCARNIQHLLREESALHLTFDPLQGSHVSEYLTNSVVQRAWGQYLKDAESGGWLELLEGGEWHQRVARGRIEGGTLFLPNDVQRGEDVMPENPASPIYYADLNA